MKGYVANIEKTDAMKLYTLYAPPNHRNGVLHKTKAEAEADEEHFDGTVSA